MQGISAGFTSIAAPFIYAVHNTGKGIKLTESVYSFAMEFFHIGKNFGFILMGGKEIALDGLKNIKKICWFSVVHGSLFVASAGIEFLCIAHNFKLLNLAGSFPFLKAFGGALFFLANVITLQYEISKIAHAIEKLRDPETRQLGIRDIISAILGIINAACYIGAGFVFLFGGPSPVAIALGAIAIAAGCLKILFDFIYAK